LGLIGLKNGADKPFTPWCFPELLAFSRLIWLTIGWFWLKLRSPSGHRYCEEKPPRIHNPNDRINLAHSHLFMEWTKTGRRALKPVCLRFFSPFFQDASRRKPSSMDQALDSAIKTGDF
jgi:hypothetical protein